MTNEAYEKMSDYYKSFIRTWQDDLCLLDKGVRSMCADFLHFEKNDENAVEVTRELEQMAARKNLYFAMFDTVDKGDRKINRVVYAYKYKHQLPLIKYAENVQGIIKESTLGKLLDCSDESEEQLYRQLLSCFKSNGVSNKEEEIKNGKEN